MVSFYNNNFKWLKTKNAWLVLNLVTVYIIVALLNSWPRTKHYYIENSKYCNGWNTKNNRTYASKLEKPLILIIKLAGSLKLMFENKKINK